MSKCKACGGAFRWAQRDGQWWKLDPDGGNHWHRCSGSRPPAKLEVVKGATTPRTDHSLPSCDCQGVNPLDDGPIRWIRSSRRCWRSTRAGARQNEKGQAGALHKETPGTVQEIRPDD